MTVAAEMGACATCGALLGPWEPRCVRCSGDRGVSVLSRAAAVLEESSEPLYVHDIRRLMDRGRRVTTDEWVLRRHLQQDLRFCWAGRNLYGLYRHGLLPAARDLNHVSLAYVYAASRPVYIHEVHFVAKQAGYVCREASLSVALTRYTAPLEQDRAGRWYLRPGSDPFIAERLNLAVGPVFHAVTSRARAQAASGLAEMMRRLQSDPDTGAPTPGVPQFAWPEVPESRYFAEGDGRVSRVHHRAVAIVEGRAVAPYVAKIPERDLYLAECIAVYRAAVGQSS